MTKEKQKCCTKYLKNGICTICRYTDGSNPSKCLDCGIKTDYFNQCNDCYAKMINTAKVMGS